MEESKKVKLEVPRRTKASLFKHVLRVYECPSVNEPVGKAEAALYLYDHDEASFRLLNVPETKESFSAIAEKQFTKLKVAMKTKREWNDKGYEKDHVIELQHITELLIDSHHLSDDNWAGLNFTAILHLGYYMNDTRNLWSIPKALNGIKGNIPLSSWRSPNDKQSKNPAIQAQIHFIREYLFLYSTKYGRTPFTELLSLSAEMAGLPENDLTWLTKAAGDLIFQLLQEWCDYGGVSKHLTERARSVNNTSMSVADIYGNEKKSWQEKRQYLKEKASRGEKLYASNIDKVDATRFLEALGQAAKADDEYMEEE